MHFLLCFVEIPV